MKPTAQHKTGPEFQRRVFFVVGPESSGTRLATRILINGGCKGSADHQQDFDHRIPNDINTLVWRRSVPHMHKWLDLRELARQAGMGRQTKYTAVVTFRDFHCMAKSQVACKHVQSEIEAHHNILTAYGSIFNQLNRYNISWVGLIYESLVLHPVKTQQWLIKWLELDVDNFQPVPVTNENTKHWQAGGC